MCLRPLGGVLCCCKAKEGSVSKRRKSDSTETLTSSLRYCMESTWAEQEGIVGERPIVFDLDNSFSKIDVLLEIGISALISKPLAVLRIIIRWRGGDLLKLKRAILELSPDIGPIPVEEEVEKIFAEAKKEDRRTILATATLPKIANHFADQVGGFDAVYCSENLNLRGEEKASRLNEVYGAGNYDYIGDSNADLPTWESAKLAFFVGPKWRRRVLSRKLSKPLLHISPKSDRMAPLRAMRPTHWVKNSLVFLAPLLALNLTLATVRELLLAFFALSLIASSMYIINDIADVRSDRQHPEKRTRPIAAGTLGLRRALILASLSLTGGFALFFMAGELEGVMLGFIYALSSLIYSSRIKLIPIVDVVALSGMYVYRVALGAALTATPLSYWLFLIGFLTFLSLALLKRSIEITSPEAGTRDYALVSRRGYGPTDAQWIRIAGISIAVATLVLLSLFVQDRFEIGLYIESSSSIFAIALIPLWGMWILKFWRDEAHGLVDSDPVKYSLTNPGSLTLLIATVAVYFAAFLG